jgi:hypothetical protein
MASNLTSSGNAKFERIKQAFKDLRNIDVLIGIPQAEDSRAGEVGNAELLFIHTNGSPLRNIPARPVIEPALEDDAPVITDILAEATKAMLEGNEDKAFTLLEKAGLEGQGASQDWFDNPKNGWAPNSPTVIAAKLKKGGTEPKPLIDTGEMRKSITYVVRKGK